MYSIQYHIVWRVKYRHRVLEGLAKKRLIEISQQITDNHGVPLLEIKTDKDHIHLRINCSLHHYLPDLLKAMKGSSARLLMKEFGEELKNEL